jgi:hypothetical protein
MRQPPATVFRLPRAGPPGRDPAEPVKLPCRIAMGPKETLPVFHCRLLSFVSRTPISAGRRCFRLLGR